MVVYVINVVLGNFFVDNVGVWCYMIVFVIIFVIVLWFGMMVFFEILRWLVFNGKVVKVLEVLK